MKEEINNSIMNNILHTSEDIKNKWCIFFDLDGTLINPTNPTPEKPFPTDVTDFRINKTILDSIRKMKKVRYIFIVSNQAGIPEYYSKNEFNAKFDAIITFIKTYINVDKKSYSQKIIVDGLYCTAKGVNAQNRKPNTGMLFRLLRKYDLYHTKTDFESHKKFLLMVGDASGIHSKIRDDWSDSDLRTARNFDIDYMDVEDFANLTTKPIKFDKKELI